MVLGATTTLTPDYKHDYKTTMNVNPWCCVLFMRCISTQWTIGYLIWWTMGCVEYPWRPSLMLSYDFPHFSLHFTLHSTLSFILNPSYCILKLSDIILNSGTKKIPRFPWPREDVMMQKSLTSTLFPPLEPSRSVSRYPFPLSLWESNVPFWSSRCP